MNPFVVHLKLTQYCKSTIYTSILKNRKKKQKQGGLALQECRDQRRPQSSNPASHLPTQTGKNFALTFAHTPPQQSVLNLELYPISNLNTPAQSSKYTRNPTTSFSHAPSPGQGPASLTWTNAVSFAVLVAPGPHPSSHSLFSQKQPPEGAREHLSQAPPPPLPAALQGSHLSESKNQVLLRPTEPCTTWSVPSLPSPPPSVPLLTLSSCVGLLAVPPARQARSLPRTFAQAVLSVQTALLSDI